MKRFAAILTICALPATAALAQSAITLGTAGSVVGSMGVNNATSGTITVTPPTGALGTPTLTWPATTGTLAVNGTGAVITTSQSPTAADFNTTCKIFTINAASLNINIPAASTLQSNGGCFFINNPSANTYTLTPNGTDNLNGSNSAKTYAAQTMTLVSSDGSTNDFAAVLGTSSSGVTSLAGTANQITASASTGAVTLSIPSAFTFPGTVLMGQAGASSAPAFKMTGAPFAGIGTASMPLFDMNVTGSTARTSQNGSGTMFGMNAADAFGGLLMDLSVGGASRYSVGYDGSMFGSGSVQTAGGSFIGFSGRSILQSPSDGVLIIENNGGTAFTRLDFGGTTSSFPALTRSAAELQVKLADDSLFANLGLATIIARGAQPTLTGTCTSGTKTGGQFSGTFVATCTAQTVIITFTTTAPTGWDCSAQDRTTVADKMQQTASSTTSCTLTGTTVASDVIGWHSIAYLIEPGQLGIPANDNRFIGKSDRAQY